MKPVTRQLHCRVLSQTPEVMCSGLYAKKNTGPTQSNCADLKTTHLPRNVHPTVECDFFHQIHDQRGGKPFIVFKIYYKNTFCNKPFSLIENPAEAKSSYDSVKIRVPFTINPGTRYKEKSEYPFETPFSSLASDRW